VEVGCNYVGANADTVEKPSPSAEEAINGVEGMRYISSSSTNSGTSSITTTFQTGYDLDIAAVDVQNRVASVTAGCPRPSTRPASASPRPTTICLWRRLLHARQPLLA